MNRKVFPILFVILIIISWLCVFADGYKTPREYENYIKNGDQQYENEIYVKALEDYNQAIQIKDSYDLTVKIINCYEKMNETSVYINACKDAIQKYPHEVDLYIRLLDYYLNCEETQKFISYVKEAKLLFPENKDIDNYYIQAKKIFLVQGTNFYEVYPCFGRQYTCYSKKREYDFENKTEKICDVGTIYSIDGDVYPFEYAEIYSSDDEQKFTVKDFENNWFLIDKNGNKIAKNENKKFSSISGFSQDLATCVIDSKYYYMNTDMEVSIKAFDYASLFSEDLAAVMKNNKWAIISKDLSDENGYLYDDIVLNSKNQCCVNGRIIVNLKGKYYILNQMGEKITENSYDYIKAFESEQPTAYKENNKWGFLTADGEKYIKPSFDDAKPFCNGYAPVKIGEKWGIIDLEGNIIVVPQYYDIQLVHENGEVFIKEDNDENWKVLYLGILYYN